MCGIIAFCRRPGSPVSPSPESEKSKQKQQLEDALELIRHRGPDGTGTWLNDNETVGLGHCRLAINDLTPAALQPLHYGGTHAVVNGEIYDYDRLREVCEEGGYKFSSTTDSELVLSLYHIHGAPGLFEHLRGEFAFVLYDETKGKTIVGRDRYGIKPLFWTTLGHKVLFAAEAKAFMPFGWEPEWDVASISACGWNSDDRTVFKGVRKLMPGQWIEISDDVGINLHKYWDLEYPDKTQPDTRNVNEIIKETRERLVEAVRLRMKADVPMGLFISGGIDSSAVAGIMTHLARTEHVRLGSEASDRVTGFTIQFPEASTHDESEIAGRTAEWLGIRHHKKLCDEAQIAADFKNAVYHAEHHVSDMNAVAKYSLASLPNQLGIKVVLTGEGADEHFLGYSFFVPEILREADLGNPESELTKNTELREKLFLSAVSENMKLMTTLGSDVYLKDIENGALEDDAIKRNASSAAAAMVALQPNNSVFAKWVHEKHGGSWDRLNTFMAGIDPDVRTKIQEKWHPGHGAAYTMAKTGLHNYILAGVSDRAEMAHSVEGRPPFMDHHLTDYVNMIPPTIKTKFRSKSDGALDDLEGFWWKSAGSSMRALTEKWLLREAVRPFVTDELYKRRKQPFMAPTKWPKDGPLQNMFKELLTEENVCSLGFVDWPTVEAALEDAFGDSADSNSFRLVAVVGGLVVLKDRFGIKTAKPEFYDAF